MEKLVDSELKVMDVLWKEGEATAKHVSDVMTERYGWNINTTYTLLKRCIHKGANPLLLFPGKKPSLFKWLRCPASCP